MVSKPKAAFKDKHKANHWKGFLDRTLSSSSYAAMVDSFITLRSRPLTSTVRDENCLMNEWEVWKNCEDNVKTFSSIYLYQKKEKDVRDKRWRTMIPNWHLITQPGRMLSLARMPSMMPAGRWNSSLSLRGGYTWVTDGRVRRGHAMISFHIPSLGCFIPPSASPAPSLMILQTLLLDDWILNLD